MDTDSDIIYHARKYVEEEMYDTLGLCSHKSFYCMFTGSEWVTGIAHIKTTYCDDAKLEDICVAETLKDALLGFISEFNNG